MFRTIPLMATMVAATVSNGCGESGSADREQRDDRFNVTSAVTAPAARSRLRATFTLAGKPYPANLSISDGISTERFTAVTRIDREVPRNGTYILEWSVRSSNGPDHVQTARDVIHQLALPAEGASLRFHLQDPETQKLLTPVILVEQDGADARVESSVSRNGSGQLELAVNVRAAPGRFVILDTIASTRRKSGLLPGLPENTFVSDHDAEFVINCNLKPPNPSPTDQLTVVPGGENAPGEPPGGGGGGEPCSSTSDDSSCDVNHCAVLPPSGELAFRTVVRPLLRTDSELLLSASLRNGASVRPSSFEVHEAPSGRVVAESNTTQAFYVPPGHYVYSFEAPIAHGSDTRFRLSFPVVAQPSSINPLAAFIPEPARLPALIAEHTGDSRLGAALRSLRTHATSEGVTVEVIADDTIWFLVPVPHAFSLDRVVEALGPDSERVLRAELDYTVRPSGASSLLIVRAEAGRRWFHVGLNPQ